MPFLWKKVKSTKLSQLVNDHLHHSQRRRDGSSLVVETGFPTSLIDLFIKNREKLKKPSKKKREKTLSPPPPPDVPFRVPPPSPANSLAFGESPLRHPSVMRSPTRPFLCDGSKENLDLEGHDGVDDERENGVERVVNANLVLFGVLKVFLVVVLAMWMKKLTVGITMSAFFLLFLEYMGRYVSGLVKPCSRAKGMLKVRVQRVCMLLRLKKGGGEEKDGGCDEDLSKSGEGCISESTEQEFQLVEQPKDWVYYVDGVWYQREVLVGNSSQGINGYQEIETNEPVMEREESLVELGELKRRKSRRQKIKSKIKKIVPKKLRSSRKEERNLERFDSMLVEKDVDEIEEGWESESVSSLSSMSSGRCKEDDRMSVVCGLGAVSEANEEAATNKEEEGGEAPVAGLNWKHLVLCVMVLVGLIGGRVLALVLALSWCFLLKFGERFQSFDRVPTTRSLFNAKSVGHIEAPGV